MIHLGPAGSPTGSTLPGIQKISELGLQAMEVQFSHGISMSDALAKQVGEEAKKYNIELSIHAPYFINLASKEKKKIQESKARILRSCELGHLMNATIVVFHPAYFGDLEKKLVREQVLEACQSMSDEVKKNKWNTILGLETTGKHSAFGSLEENIDICKNVPGCQTVIDFAHIYARQYGKIDYAEILEKVKHVKHLHCHFSNIKYSSKGELSHLPMDGHPSFKPLAEEIIKRKLDITIISESPVTWQDSLKQKEIFEKLGHHL